ncbi:hypothetical protein TNCV_3843501 [Trichonephila clavipes]|nr:hypothetical protein TNCV_3843501 [Trichonephila clavipes]
MAERKLRESEATMGFFVLLDERGKKDMLEWCMKVNLISSQYEFLSAEMICDCKSKRRRLMVTNGIVIPSRKIIPTTLFGV